MMARHFEGDSPDEIRDAQLGEAETARIAEKLHRERMQRDLLAAAKEKGGGYLDWETTPFVACDQPCFALRYPQTLEEYKAALEHWRSHEWLGGCSHSR